MERPMRTFLLLFLCISISFQTFSQDQKKLKKLYSEAVNVMLQEDYAAALDKFLALEQMGLKNANTSASIGICYLNIVGENEKAIPYLEKGVQDVTSSYKEGNYKEEKAPIEAWFYLAKAYRFNEQYEKSIEAYKKYKTFVEASDVWFHDFIDLQVQSCQNAMDFMQNPVKFNEILEPFNRDGENYYPVISGDGKTLLFTAYQETIDKRSGDVEYLEVIYYSKYNGQEWSEPIDITGQLASDGYFSTCHVNFDGTFLLMYKWDYEDENIYYSELVDGEWSSVTRMKKNISSNFNESHASISPDGEAIYFARETELQTKDIFVSRKDKKGRWGVGVPLPASINTPYEEDTPFLANDGKTLYFASEGHNSMGGYDIFKSVYDETLGTWSEPQNLGYPINSSKDDIFFVPIGDQSEAFMARYPEGSTQKKIYRLEFKNRERVVKVPTEVSPIAADVPGESPSAIDSTTLNTGQTAPTAETKTLILPSEYELQGSIKLMEDESLDQSFYVHIAQVPNGNVVAAISPDVTTGEFKAMLKPGNYNVKVFGEGYEPAEQPLFISDLREEPQILAFVQMQKTQTAPVEPIADNTSYENTTQTNTVDANAKNTSAATQTSESNVAPFELKGRLRLGDNKNPNSSFKITVKEDGSGKIVDEIRPDAGTGNFTTRLHAGTYQVKAEGNGYDPAEKTINITQGQANSQVFTFLEMSPSGISSGEFVEIKSILFEYGSAELNQGDEVEIEKLARLMEVNPSLYVEVQGNTDNKGNDAQNLRLSMQRSRSVVSYLLSRGIEPHRFVSRAFGEENAVAMNENPDGSDNPEGRALNRRVDIKIFPTTSDQVKTQNIYVPEELLYRDLLTYTVLLAETDKPLDASFFAGINNVWINKVGKGYIYSVGKYKNKNDALKMMDAVVDGGFPDASIISNLEYGQLKADKEGIYKAKLQEEDKRIYTIQLAAVKKPLEVARFPKGSKEHLGADGYHRYIYGEYSGKVSAKQALAAMVNKGYVDAFIVEKNKFNN
jgi:outer membrane protein OmpA-like peptidoglycan-associated protein/tetratricopeptide (TPR) repeat protein